MATAGDLLWQLYVEALERGLRIPPEADFLATASAMPLALNIATTVDPVPLPQALAEVFRLGDTMPAWRPVYQPSADGSVWREYEAFVYAIAVPPDGGPQYRPVRQARQLLRQVEDEIAAAGGSLVMTIATAAGERVVPRYETGPLGVPGYSQWLEFAILAFVHSLPPEVDVTVYAADAKRAGRAPAVASATRELPPWLDALSAAASPTAEEIVSLRLVIQSTTHLPLAPGAWFLESLLRSYTRPEQFIPGTPFASGPIWGPQGILNLFSVGFYAGFRPEVTVMLTPSGFSRLAAGLGEGSIAGPAGIELRLDRDRHAIAAADTSLQGMLLGVVVDAPNYPSGP